MASACELHCSKKYHFAFTSIFNWTSCGITWEWVMSNASYVDASPSDFIYFSRLIDEGLEFSGSERKRQPCAWMLLCSILSSPSLGRCWLKNSKANNRRARSFTEKTLGRKSNRIYHHLRHSHAQIIPSLCFFLSNAIKDQAFFVTIFTE